MLMQIMTFNLRYGSMQKPHSWPERRPVNKKLIEVASPDLIGIQEGFYWVLREMEADQPDYDWIGLGREGGSRSEFSAIFYKKGRFEPLEFDHFWLSDTPNVVGSSTWGNSNKRMVTWVKFRDKQDGNEFYHWNTHFDHETPGAREKSAKLVLERMAALKTTLPIILTGDFNADDRNSETYDILTGKGEGQGNLTDLWFAAEKRFGPSYASFHGYKPPVKDGHHIDWILARGNVKAREAQLVDFNIDGQYPSDHFPIMVAVDINKG